MKRIILFSLFVSSIFTSQKVDYAKIISSNIESSTIEFNFENFNLEPVQLTNQLMYRATFKNGASFLKEGAPDLQKYSKSIIIPDDAEMSINIISSKFTDYENISIAPSKGNLSRLIDPNDIPFIKGNEYNINGFFPSNLVNLQSPYILKNLRGQAIDFHPIQYNPITKTLRVYSQIIVEVYNSGTGKANVLSRQSYKQKLAAEFKNIYKGHFLNFNNDNRFDYLNDQGNMLIISSSLFLESMEPFVEWKTKKGIPTEMVSLADIGSSSSAIKAFVENYYEEKGLTFLLLVGDVAQIPTPTISGSASDPSYGFIIGNDSYAEVIVGRFSGSTPAQISTQVERSINYERYPETNTDWYDNAMGIASDQGPGYGGYTDAQFNDFLWDDIISDFTYDNYQYSYDGQGGSVSQGMSIINNGISLINYTGHGSISSWGNGAALSTSNVNSLTNVGALPFVISVACNTGEFNSTNECFAESWLRATNNGEPTGAVGFLGSTISMSWEPPMHGQMAMNLILTESYEEQITRSIGGISTNGCLYMNDAQGSSGINETNYWTLFGDPSLEIRTDQPTNLNIIHDAAIVVGQSELVVDTGTDHALVAISKNNQLYAHAYSQNGVAVLSLENSDLLPGDYDFVVTSFNAYPYETTLSVITPEGPYLTFNSYNVVSEDNSPSGPSNGIIEYGETISLSLSANNVGVDQASNVSAVITNDDIYISLNQSNVNFGDISANGSSTSGNITFDVAHNVPDGHTTSFSILFTSDQGQWDATFNVNISAPLFTVSNPSFIDQGGDGIWDAGETITLSLLLNNEGSADHYFYPGIHLSENSVDASIAEGMEFNWLYGIESDSSVPMQFTISASEDANMGTEVTFIAYATEMNCEDNCIESETFEFNLVIGLATDDSLYEPLDLIAEAGDDSIELNWSEPFTCPDGQFADCIGQCVEEWYESWLGDGLCDDGTWGVYFNCDEFDNDGGDCGDILTCEDQGLITCPSNGECVNDLDECPETSCDPGYIQDCVDEDCCPESWIGDGFADCEDQAYGCDLTCYDNDGGDCGNRNENSSTENKVGQMYPNKLSADFSNAIIIPLDERDVDGYFIYKEGSYIAFTENLNYTDSDVNTNTEYCYYITAVYEEGQSGSSNTSCATLEGDETLIGDLNYDGILNILDLIIMANMALGTEDPELSIGDLNGDGIINILDIIALVNSILDRRSIDLDRGIGSNATLYEEGKSAFISADGDIAGIQISVKAKDILINNDILLTISSTTINDQHTILIYGANGETLAGDKIKLFTSSEEFEISSIIVSNILSDAMRINNVNNIIPNKFALNQNFPNPFNPNTMIEYSIDKSEQINLNIYDIQGKLISSLINNSFIEAGSYQIMWDGTNNEGIDVPSGMYIYKLKSDSKVLSRKMVLMK